MHQHNGRCLVWKSNVIANFLQITMHCRRSDDIPNTMDFYSFLLLRRTDIDPKYVHLCTDCIVALHAQRLLLPNWNSIGRYIEHDITDKVLVELIHVLIEVIDMDVTLGDTIDQPLSSHKLSICTKPIIPCTSHVTLCSKRSTGRRLGIRIFVNVVSMRPNRTTLTLTQTTLSLPGK
jgi:hypothetical protein